MPQGWRPEAYIGHAFGIISGPPQQVKVAFAPSVASYIRERTWHPTQTFRTLPDGWLELSMQVAVTVELTSWLRGFGEDARVNGPDSLRADVVESLRRAVSWYDGAAG